MERTTTSRHRRLGPRKDPAIDAAVLAATRTLLVERGYAATSIDLIATTAGVSRPAVYRRWESKARRRPWEDVLDGNPEKLARRCT